MNARPAWELLARGSLQLGYRKLYVRSFVAARRCYNCQALGDHVADQCRNETICVKCGGNHHKQDCPGKTLSCINCKEHNQSHTQDGHIKRQDKRHTDHAANHPNCPSWQAYMTAIRASN